MHQFSYVMVVWGGVPGLPHALLRLWWWSTCPCAGAGGGPGLDGLPSGASKVYFIRCCFTAQSFSFVSVFNSRERETERSRLHSSEALPRIFWGSEKSGDERRALWCARTPYRHGQLPFGASCYLGQLLHHQTGTFS